MSSPKRLRFTKMQGQGNDFMVIDAVRQPGATLAPERVRALARAGPARGARGAPGGGRAPAGRHFGVGFDQLLLVEPARSPGNDFRYRIFNADGGEVEQCGNGARCFARFVLDEELTAKR